MSRTRRDMSTQRVVPSRRVEKLPESHSLPLAQRPDVYEGNVELLAGSLRDAAVTPDHDDLVAAVDELLGVGRELRPPVAVERIEDVAPHLVETLVVAAMWQPLRLVPLDVGGH